jgi:hypothetical protein
MTREGTLYLVKNPEKIFFFPPYYYHWLTPRGCRRDGGGVGGGIRGLWLGGCRLAERHHICRLPLRPDGEVTGGVLRCSNLAVGAEE